MRCGDGYQLTFESGMAVLERGAPEWLDWEQTRHPSPRCTFGTRNNPHVRTPGGREEK